MKMSNKDLIQRCNALDDLLTAEDKSGSSEFSGVVLLKMTRNLRAMVAEYENNYSLDYKRYLKRYYADDGKTLLPDVKKEDAEKELSELLNFEVDVPISTIKPEDVENVHSVSKIMALDFMIL